MNKILLFTFIIAVMACGHQQEKEHNHTGSDNEFPEMSTNKGKRWVANVATSTGVDNMSDYIKKFRPENDIYDSLAQNLEFEYQGIIKNCTMKGEGHQQLHNFLIPITHYLDILKEGHKDEQAKAVQQLDKHLRIYNDFFE